VLFYGARHPIDLANHNWFKDIETTFTNFTYCPVVSRPSNIWFGATGHVQLPLRSFLEAHHAKNQCLFFLCGPSAMMKEVKDMLIDYSIDPNAITVEAFASSTTHQV
jgi:Na+-transporting NADH:ubiquinone oxidoreductase subunit NqrF